MQILEEKFGVGICCGADVVPEELAGYFKQKNHEVIMLEGLNFWNDNEPDSNGYRVSNGEEILRTGSIDELYNCVLEGDYDIVHSHTRSKKLIELNKEFKKRGIPLIHTVHGRDELDDRISRELMEISDLITAPSYYVTEEIRRIVPHKRTLAVPNSTDFTDYKQNKKVIEMSASFRKKFRGDSENKIVLSVGRLQEDKGVYETAEAVVNLINNGKNIKMVHVGPCFNEEDKKRLEYIFNDYPNRLEIVGKKEKEDLPALYKAGDVLILPSDLRYENFPLVALESLAMETPVIISNVGGSKEVFVDPGLAIGVSPRNVKSIENGINYVMDNYSQEKKRAEKASRIIEEFYHTDFISEVWLGIYNKLRENSN